MNPGLITLMMFGLMFVGLVLGFRLGFLLGAIAVVFIIWLWGPHALSTVALTIYGRLNTFTLVCIPLFIFMAMVLQYSGVADDLYGTMHHWMGGLRGGLAMGTVGICTIFAAMSGGAAMGVTTMGIIALPAMLKRNYDKHIVIGAIMAGGPLGALIPPSIIMIFYSLFSGESIGALFIGGVFPGLMLSAIFITYIGIRAAIKPSLGPPLAPEERGSWREKLISLRGVILPILLILGILGSIFTGIATPTEASAVGAFGALISAAINRKLNWQMVKTSCLRTFSTFVMVMWVVFGASCFAMVYRTLGAADFISGIITELAVNRWLVLIAMQISWLIFGCLLDSMSILMITAPMYLPIVGALGFNPLWFGILFVVNMEVGLMTPPFGFGLFYFKAVVPEEITMADIYRSIIPFVGLYIIGIAIIMVFPQLALWLPGQMIKVG